MWGEVSSIDQMKVADLVTSDEVPAPIRILDPREQEAVDALANSRSWAILLEMQAEGAWPGVLGSFYRHSKRVTG